MTMPHTLAPVSQLPVAVKRSVLLVDDDPAVLTFLRQYFDREGWDVDFAVSGEDALRAFALRRHDLVLLDLNLPGMGGFQVLDVLVARQGIVVVLTAQAEVEVAVEAISSGAHHFLTKPVELEHLGAVANAAVPAGRARRATPPEEDSEGRGHDGIRMGPSPLMKRFARHVDLVAGAGATTVLLQGESGTGKSWLAQELHRHGPRRQRPFVEVNCAGLSAAFLDSELFGHERGAFTDAHEARRGLFEIADGGTLFLDEIGELAPQLQPKLLKVLETGVFRRLGGITERRVDVRLIAATHRELAGDVRSGRFRADLYYRLSVFPLTVPSLRDRSREDVLELVESALGELRGRHEGSASRLSAPALDALLRYSWPGNVRELRNVIERALVLARGAEAIGPEHLPDAVRAREGARAGHDERQALTLEEVERRHIERTLLITGGNRTAAAERMGISRVTLHARVERYSLADALRPRVP